MVMEYDQHEFVKAFVRMRKDLVASEQMMSRDQIKFVLDHYYKVQKIRESLHLQSKELEKSEKPNLLISYTRDMFKVLESQFKLVLNEYTNQSPMGKWARKIVGIGPVLAAALDVYIDINKAPYVTNIWSYAGLVADIQRISPKKAEGIVKDIVKGKTATDDELMKIVELTCVRIDRRLEQLAKLTKNPAANKPTKENLIKALSLLPWNPNLKRVCYLIGQSFLKTSSNEKSFYGKILREFRTAETIKSEKGHYSEMAKKKVDTVGKDTVAYSYYVQGKLPPAHILNIAMRKTVKIFLEHWFSAAYELVLGKTAPDPYPHAILGHKDKIEREK